MLEVCGIKKSFHDFRVLSGLDLKVPEGALYGFVGPNGAGKTTAIRIFTGLLEPDEGSVRIAGLDALREPFRVREYFGYVPDEFGMYDDLKVSEYMEFFAGCHGITGLAARERARVLLEQVQLTDRSDDFVDSLSRGMKQRLCLARAMIHDPGLLILDEPTSGMDPRTRLEFKEILKELCAEGKTILISSHILAELSQMCTDIGIIDAGRLVLSGSMAEILKRVNDSNPLRLRVREKREEAAALLRADPRISAVTIDRDEFFVRFNGENGEEADLLTLLVENGIPVLSFSREQGDLEHVFMQITGHAEEKLVLRMEPEFDREGDAP